jgi:hypothetical protein
MEGYVKMFELVREKVDKVSSAPSRYGKKLLEHFWLPDKTREKYGDTKERKNRRILCICRGRGPE